MNYLLVALLALSLGAVWFGFRAWQVKPLEGSGPRETAFRDKLIDLNTQLGSGEINQEEYDRRRKALSDRESG